jgi:transposase
MRLSDYKEEQIKEFIMSGVAKPEVLRDYGILQDLKTGANMLAVAERHKVSERTIIRVKQKYG